MSRTRQPPASTPQSRVTTQARESSTARTPGTLRLRGEDIEVNATREPSSTRRIQWSEDVIDNEGMGKKSSKVCCIYHKSRPVGESSSESESSDSSSSDSDSDSDMARGRGRANHARSRRAPDGLSSEQPVGGGSPDACCSQHHNERKKRRKPSPNAYEKMPKTSKSHSRGT